MPSTKDPCLNCKEKHVRCDVGVNRSQCRRCLAKGLECCRSGRKTSFRPGSSARYDTQFSGSQSWVNSNTKRYRLQTPKSRSSHNLVQDQGVLLTSPSTEVAATNSQPDYTEAVEKSNTFAFHVVSQKSPSTTGSVTSSLNANETFCTSFSSQPASLEDFPAQINYQHEFSIQEPFISAGGASGQESSPVRPCQPFEDIQEACLLRYYVEELSHWFDTCDEHKHFRLLVPIRARRYPPLLHAIFATSARHLSRLPQYKTPEGILYHGHLLPNVTPSSAVEYMLTCIPALREFHETRDEEHREHIIATAVILRQFEEMEDDEEETNDSAGVHANNLDDHAQERVNFLAIINSVIRSSHSKDFFHHQGLFNASYWIALRQEVYYAFTRKHSPKMLLEPALWPDTTIVNKMIMHAAQVAKWLWDDKSEHEWLRLKEQENILDQQVSDEYAPIFKREADKSKGEILPTIWYGSDRVVTGTQHMMIAKMVLMAESPFLKYQSDLRAATRNVESEVRMIVLDLCGIALHHPRSPPNLVNATIGILLYGEYFTDKWERKALAGVVDRFKNVCAWPLPKALRLF